jgi:hypothetical protein
MILARLGTTRFGTNSAELWEGEVLIAKMYANSDGSRIRIVLPELTTMKQTRIDPDSHYLEFQRRV